MVGVPGRSTSCWTCRQRKKGCDRLRPSCGQCTRLQIPCGGYDKIRIFVNTVPEQANGARAGFVAASYSSAAGDNATKCKWAADVLAKKALASFSSTQQSLSAAALYSLYLDGFWSAFLPGGVACSKRSAECSHIGWSIPVQTLCERSGLVRFALLSNALGVLGQQSGKSDVRCEGLRLYGKVLQLFARSLPAREESGTEELLATSMLLGQYEVLQGAANLRSTFASGQRWLSHSLGAEAIILERGPEFFSTGIAHHLFINSRLHLTTLHLRDRRRSPLGTAEWKTVPWTRIPKDPKNELLDVLIEIPAILEALDVLADGGEDCQYTEAYLHQSLAEQCWLCDSLLQQWASSSGENCIGFVEEIVAGNDKKRTTPSSEDIARGHLGLLYWTTCLILYQNLCNISACSTSHLPKRMEPRQYCRKIMELMSFFQTPSVGKFFVNIVSFPAIVAMRFVERHDPPNEISEECRLVLTGFKGKYQSQMENFLGGWPWRFEYQRRLKQQLKHPLQVNIVLS